MSLCRFWIPAEFWQRKSYYINLSIMVLLSTSFTIGSQLGFHSHTVGPISIHTWVTWMNSWEMAYIWLLTALHFGSTRSRYYRLLHYSRESRRWSCQILSYCNFSAETDFLRDGTRAWPEYLKWYSNAMPGVSAVIFECYATCKIGL